jgi:hypothetical protein
MEGRAIVFRPRRDGLRAWRLAFDAMLLVGTPVVAYFLGVLAAGVPVVPGFLLALSAIVAGRRRGLDPWIVLTSAEVRVEPFVAPSGSYREEAHRAARIEVDGRASEGERIRGVLVVERPSRRNVAVFLVTTERAVLVHLRPTRKEAEALAAELAALLGPEARTASTLRDPSVPDVNLGWAAFAFVGEIAAVIMVGPLALAFVPGPNTPGAEVVRGAAAAVMLVLIDVFVVRALARRYAAKGRRVLEEALEELQKTQLFS